MFETRRSATDSISRKLYLGGAIMSLTLALAACGGGDDDAAASQNVSGNQAPSISGAPPAQAMQGQQYAFKPTASDPNGDALTFSIAGMPSGWSFNTATGELTGTPASAGTTFSNIRISVSDGTTTVNLTAFNITVVATATGSALLTWNPPATNTDGSALSNLAGYRVYWGTSQNNLTNSVTINNPGLSSYMVEQLTPATWHFAVTALNANSVESSMSNFASKQVL